MYTPISTTNNMELDRRFTHHPPKGDQAKRYEVIRKRAREFAGVLCECAPLGTRELEIAMAHLEDAVMWANAAIARNE